MEKVELTFEVTLEFNKMCAELLVEIPYVQSYSNNIFDKSFEYTQQNYKSLFVKNDVILGYIIDLTKLKFHTSWDWIMEVWIKLNQIYSQKGLYSYEIFHNNSIILCFKEIGLLCGDLKIAVECLYKFLKIHFEIETNK
jgi:hypothetical protein